MTCGGCSYADSSLQCDALCLRVSANHPVSFFDEVKRIVDPDYVPNEMDVLRARTKTTGIYETRFQMGQLSIQYAGPSYSV